MQLWWITQKLKPPSHASTFDLHSRCTTSILLMKDTIGLAQLIVQWDWQNPSHSSHSSYMASGCLMARHSISIRVQPMLQAIFCLVWDGLLQIALSHSRISQVYIGVCYKFHERFFPITNISKTIQKIKSYGPWGRVSCITAWVCFRGQFTLKPGNLSYHSVNGFGQDSKG